MKKNKKIYLLDGSSYIYRAFYAIRPFSNSKGLPTNAIYGFVRMLLKLIDQEKPDYLVVAFDSKGKNFRHEEYSEYKANRSKMPEDLIPQIPYIKKVVGAFNIQGVAHEGVEADDILGTLAKRAEREGLFVVIVTGDKDLMQLVGASIHMLDTMKNKVFDSEAVKKKFGVDPQRVTEVMGLMGDRSDNIPGVPGIGEKTATALIAEFGSIESVISNAESIKKNSVKKKILENKELARLSKSLVTLETDLPLSCSTQDFVLAPWNNQQLLELFQELEFNKLLEELGLHGQQGDIAKQESTLQGTYTIVKDDASFCAFSKEVCEKKCFSFDIVSGQKEAVAGVSVCSTEGMAYFISLDDSLDILPGYQKEFQGMLADPDIAKYGHDLKRGQLLLAKSGLRLEGFAFDSMIAAYLLNPAMRVTSLTDIVKSYLSCQLQEEQEEADSMKKADAIFRLAKGMPNLLEKEGLETLFYNIEMPLVTVLSTIEAAGVKIDTDLLRKVSLRLSEDIGSLELKIHELAGETFNINSPKQLGEILFQKLQLKGGRKIKTGYSTDVKVLESLADKHPLPSNVLEFRHLMKVKSTYVDALPRMVDEHTHRIHTSYNQAVTVTGRLSSSDPNLQNIPIRTPLGREIRRAFIPQQGFVLLSADYSQVELRVLAHLSGDETLIDAFNNGEDIHERTALEVFGVLKGLVSPEMRRMAKAINFGIVYGMSPFGLSKSLGKSKKDASEFLDNYFLRYEGVKKFMNKTIEEARKNGYVSTLFHRKRTLPELNSSNFRQREMAERMAINTPVQGTAADLIKVAMINVSQELQAQDLKSYIIMQVHDELVLEVRQDEIEQVKKIVRDKMEHVASLSVPLSVDIKWGENWDQAH